MKDLARKLSRYVCTGGAAAIVDAGGFWILCLFRMPIIPAATISFSAAAVVNFLLTSKLVFRQRATPQRFLLFVSVAIIGLCVNVGITWVGIVYLGVRPVFAKIGGIASAFSLNFTLNAAVVFRAAGFQESRKHQGF